MTAAEHHVLGLQVAVHDAELVRLRERIRHVAQDPSGHGYNFLSRIPEPVQCKLEARACAP